MTETRTVRAAKMFARDFPHLMGVVRCAVQVECRIAQNLLVLAGCQIRPHISATVRAVYSLEPFTLHDKPDAVRQIRSGTKNKRLLAAIDFAVATKSTITVDLSSSADRKARIKVNRSLLECDMSKEAMSAAARWARIEHTEALRMLQARSGQDPATSRFGIEPADDAAHFVWNAMAAFYAMGKWAKEQLIEPKTVLPTGAAAIDRLTEILAGLPSRGMSKAQARRLDEARALAAALPRAA